MERSSAPTSPIAKALWRGVNLSALIILLAIGATTSACGRSEALGSPQRPLVLLLSPAYASPETGARLGRALSARSGLAIHVEVAATSQAALDRGASADAALLPVLDYLLVRQEHRAEARLQVLRAGGRRTYAGALLVRADDPAPDLHALEGKVVAYVDPSSTTGYLLAARALASAGVQITPLFTGSHEAAVAALRNGTAAAAATYADPTRPGLRALAPTGEVMNEPVFFRRDVPEAIRGRLAQALTDLAESAEGTAVLADFGGVSGFAPVTDEAYTPVRDLLAATQHDLESLVSGGKAFVDRNRLVLGGVGL